MSSVRSAFARAVSDPGPTEGTQTLIALGSGTPWEHLRLLQEEVQCVVMIENIESMESS